MPKLIERSDLKASSEAAQQALIDDAGASQQRANEVVEAVAKATVEESLAQIAGETEVTGSVVDARLARLRGVLDALGDGADPLTPYEVGAIFRITPTQGRTLLRTYQARYSSDYRGRMSSAIKAAGNAGNETGLGKKKRYEFPFTNQATLEYAAEWLRRHGYERSLRIDREGLMLSIESAVSVDSKDAKAFLKQ